MLVRSFAMIACRMIVAASLSSVSGVCCQTIWIVPKR